MSLFGSKVESRESLKEPLLDKIDEPPVETHVSETELQNGEPQSKWVESDPLSETQINYARLLLEKTHQLRDKHIEVVWPFLKYTCCCFLKKRKPSFKYGLKKAIRHKLGIKISSSDAAIEKHPFLLFGYGMNAYFDLMLDLLYMMMFLSLLSIPLMFKFASFSGLQGSASYSLSQYSLGNLGGSNTQCSHSPFITSLSKVEFSCSTGTLDTSAID